MKATLLERLVKSVKGEAKKFDPLGNRFFM